MKQFEIKSFLNLNSEEKLLDAYKSVYEKNKEINKRRNQLILLMLVTAAFYFISKKSAISNIQLGPVSLNDYAFIEILVPGFFSYLFYEFILITSHQFETSKALKSMNLALYKYPVLLQLKKKESHLLYILLPYSASNEIRRRLIDKKSYSLFEKAFILPVFLIILLPIWFVSISIWNVYVHYWDNWIGKVSVVFSIWMFAIMAILTFRNIADDNKKEIIKPEKNNTTVSETSEDQKPDNTN